MRTENNGQRTQNTKHSNEHADHYSLFTIDYIITDHESQRHYLSIYGNTHLLQFHISRRLPFVEMNKILLLSSLLSIVSGKHIQSSADAHQGSKERELPLAHDQSCGDNEEWVTCHSSSCFDKICEDVQHPERPRSCDTDCSSGCSCAAGFVRNKSDGLCSHQDTCFSAYYQQ